MRIIEFRAANVKRLKVVEITPDGNLVVISGKNAQGKTSVLDAIWLAVAGGEAAKSMPRPIRDGEESAEVRLDLGDLVVKRRWTANDRTYLTVETQDGAQYKSPQAMLDGLVGGLSFDPLAFTLMSPKEQRETLQGLIGFDPTELDKKRQQAYEHRTEANREIKRIEGVIGGMPEPSEDLPEEEASAAVVMEEYRVATETQQENERLRAVLRNEREEARVRQETMRQLIEEDGTAQKQLALLETEVAGLEEPDLDAIRQRAADVEVTNAAVRASIERAKAQRLLKTEQGNSAGLTAKIEAVDAEKAAAIQNATMPIEDLAIDADGVTYKGIPFTQCSSAEQLRVSLAMAMALNPQLRVILIRDGSLLDSDNREIIAKVADDNDCQVWMERVDDGNPSVVIEDGQVVTGGIRE